MQRKYSSSVKVFYPEYSHDDLLNILKQRVEALKRVLPISLVVLFGSYARNTYTVASDIDLLVVYKGHTKDAYAKARKAIGLRLVELHLYSEEEYFAMKETLERMTADGTAIYTDGILEKRK